MGKQRTVGFGFASRLSNLSLSSDLGQTTEVLLRLLCLTLSMELRGEYGQRQSKRVGLPVVCAPSYTSLSPLLSPWLPCEQFRFNNGALYGRGNGISPFFPGRFSRGVQIRNLHPPNCPIWVGNQRILILILIPLNDFLLLSLFLESFPISTTQFLLLRDHSRRRPFFLLRFFFLGFFLYIIFIFVLLNFPIALPTPVVAVARARGSEDWQKLQSIIESDERRDQISRCQNQQRAPEDDMRTWDQRLRPYLLRSAQDVGYENKRKGPNQRSAHQQESVAGIHRT